jgi:radical SAM superfamily enzyme YgiQ (UPF0313 family)
MSPPVTCRAAPAPLRYEEPVYRPPSEQKSLLLQATIGCSWNQCTFCGMYRGKRFRVRRIDEVRAEILWARDHAGPVTRVFLADGDALMAPPRYLHEVLDALHDAFPHLDRVACYASPQSLQARKWSDLVALRQAGLSHYYLGVESGHDAVLERLSKGVDALEMIRVANKASRAGVSLSTMVLLGAGGRGLSRDHARASAHAINCIQPKFLSTLVMTPVEGTPLWEEVVEEGFDDLSSVELTQELRTFLDLLQLDDTVFRANHATNHVVLGGTLPTDKAALLKRLDLMLADPEQAPFVPAERRAI